MKKVLMLVVATVLSVVCLAFAGCIKIEGTYKFKSLSVKSSGIEMNLEVGEEFMGMITLTENFVILTLNEDGTCVVTFEDDSDSERKGTWEKDCDVVKVTFEDGEEQEVKIDGKNLIFEIEEDGEVIELVLSK